MTGACASTCRPYFGSGPVNPISLRAFYKTVTMDTITYAVGSHANMPIAIIISADADLMANANANGYDMILGSLDGTTVYPHDRVYWDPSTGNLMMVVRRPISNVANQQINLYYGYPAATDSSDPPDVWQDYREVRICNSTSSLIDRSGNNGAMTNVGSFPLGWDTLLGIGIVLDGTSDAFALAGPTLPSGALELTLSTVFTKVNTTGDIRAYAQQLTGAQNDARYMLGTMGASFRSRLAIIGNPTVYTPVAGAVSTTLPNFVCTRYQSAVSGGRIELIGGSSGLPAVIATGNSQGAGGINVDATHATGLGYDGNGTNFMNGTMYNVAGALTAFSDNYISTWRNLMRSLYLSIGAQQVNPY